MTTNTTTRSDIPRVPAPWNFRAEAWWFVTSLSHSDKSGESLPINYFPAREETLYKQSSAHGAHRGGRGRVTVVRYTESPIGPYDELTVSPGEFSNPFGAEAHRVTRAYASTLAAVVNGRANWGRPYELAEFVFTPSLEHEHGTEIRVFPATSFVAPITYAHSPCFAALVRSVKWLPGLPLHLDWFSHPKVAQPPLEESPDSHEDGQVGTGGKWHVFDPPSYHGRTKPFRCQGLLKDVDAPEETSGKRRSSHMKFGDGVGFPDIVPYSLGVHWRDVVASLPEATPLAAP